MLQKSGRPFFSLSPRTSRVGEGRGEGGSAASAKTCKFSTYVTTPLTPTLSRPCAKSAWGERGKKWAFLFCLFLASPAHADGIARLEIVNAAPLEAGKPATVTVKLTDARTQKPLGWGDLKTVHTARLHALIIDGTLTDYHHVHPLPARKKNPGEYSFTFTPEKPGDYRIFADITPAATGKQEFAKAVLKAAVRTEAHVDKTVNDSVTVDSLTFTLSFETPPRAGEAAMGMVEVAKGGKPFAKLEPVMGAYAHIVGFGEDGNSVTHIHPMDGDAGGPMLMFHMAPSTAGFMKLFVQVRVGGQDVFAPFGVMVK